MIVATKDKFEPGAIVVTSGVDADCKISVLFMAFVVKSLKRHLSGDWGEMCAQDKQINDDALKPGAFARLFSAYKQDKFKFWIITEADRSVTTILYPDEY
jgi:hypothetical protein